MLTSTVCLDNVVRACKYFDSNSGGKLVKPLRGLEKPQGQDLHKGAHCLWHQVEMSEFGWGEWWRGELAGFIHIPVWEKKGAQWWGIAKLQFKIGLKKFIIQWGLVHQKYLGAQLLLCPVLLSEFWICYSALRLPWLLPLVRTNFQNWFQGFKSILNFKEKL